MSHVLTSLVWDMDIPDPIEKLVLLSLANHASDDGHCWPSVARIVTKTRLCERTIREKLKTLRDHGYLKVGYNLGHSSDYILHIPGAPKPTDKPIRTHKKKKHTPAPNAPLPGSTCTTPLHQMQEGGAAGAPIIYKESVSETIKGRELTPSERISKERYVERLIKEIDKLKEADMEPHVARRKSLKAELKLNLALLGYKA